MTAKTREGGGLVWRVAKVPSEPTKLSEQQQRKVRMRLGVGESQSNIASSYGVDVAEVARMAR
jgi:hypothetical protein